jgi:cytochrome c
MAAPGSPARSLLSLPLKGGGLGWGSAEFRFRKETPTRTASLSDLPLSGGGKQSVWHVFLIAAPVSILLLALPAHAQLRGHGGPVRAVVVSADGKQAVSGSFDTSAIRWSLQRNVAEQVLRFHDAAVNAVAYLPDGRIATAGADGKIAIWTPGKPDPERVLEGHTAPIAAIAVSPDGKTLASAAWDHTVRLWPLAGGTPRVLQGHTQNVNGVAFTPDGKSVVSAGYDASVRIWPLAGGAETIRTLPTPLNGVAVAAGGEIVAAGADGKLYFLSAQGEPRGEAQASQTPIIALALSGDGKLAAAAGIRGSVAIVDRASRQVLRTLVGPGLPVWSVAFLPDNHTLLTGGADRTVRRWNAMTGEPADTLIVGAPDDPLAAYANDPGARVFRACVACHTLTPDEGNKAGPSLWHIFGRKIGSLPGYRYSPALTKMNIVWSPETVSKMFEVGPMAYTPGTKMPEQTIGSADDRKALVEFLQKVTK